MYFQILDAKAGGYFVRIRGGNHETLFHSEVYTTKAGCWNVINVVQTGAASALVYDETVS